MFTAFMSEILHGEKYFFAGFAAAELEKIAMNLKKQRLVEKAPDARNSEDCAATRTFSGYASKQPES